MPEHPLRDYRFVICRIRDEEREDIGSPPDIYMLRPQLGELLVFDGTEFPKSPRGTWRIRSISIRPVDPTALLHVFVSREYDIPMYCD